MNARYTFFRCRFRLNPVILLPALAFSLCALSGCFILGIHVQVHNASCEGKYPRFSAATRLLGNEKTKYRTCFDATYYDLNVAVNGKKKYLKGSVKMNATALSDFDTLQLDLHANMKLNRVTAGGKELGFRRVYGAVFIALTQKAGEKFSLTMEYEGKPVEAKKPPWKGGFVWKKDKQKNPWIGVACESEGASIWWPCKDVNDDEPDSVSLRITVPKNLMAVSNGQFRGKKENGDSATYAWVASYPINLYDVTLYIGAFVPLADSYTSPVSGKIIPFNHYVLPPNYDKAKVHFAQAKTIFAFYEKTFGEFPWPRDGYKLIESPYEGMEHQSAIAYGNGFKNMKGEDFDYIILHESAHEWWGNAVSASDFADVWLQEGFATYSEALYVESMQGKSAYLNYMLFYRIFIKNKWPVVGPSGYRYFYYKNSDCYQKGAWTLHSLRTLVDNDSLFFDILKSFQEKYRYKSATSQNFIDLVNNKTGEDFTWLFAQYLYKRKAPFLRYCWDGRDLYYRWDYTDSTFKLPVQIALDNMVKTTLFPSNRVQKIPISRQTYKDLFFDNYTVLFGIREDKRLKKQFGK